MQVDGFTFWRATNTAQSQLAQPSAEDLFSAFRLNVQRMNAAGEMGSDVPRTRSSERRVKLVPAPKSRVVGLTRKSGFLKVPSGNRPLPCRNIAAPAVRAV